MVKNAYVEHVIRQITIHFNIDGKYKVDPKTGIVNVQGDVNLSVNSRIKELPVEFGTVTGNFICLKSQLTTLTGSPQQVHGNFWCAYSPINTLEGAPAHVGGEIDVRYCNLKNFVGAPTHVGSNFWGRRNPVESLEGLPAQIPGELDFDWNPTLPILRSLIAKTVDAKAYGYHDYEHAEQVNAILNRHAGSGKSGAIACAIELVKAGFKGNARW